jgi:hypothetical protein
MAIDEENALGRCQPANDPVTKLQFRILGPLEVASGNSLLAIGGAKQRALLAILLLSANEVVPADRLVDALWGERPPESGRTALQVRVSQLRKALGLAGALIVTREPGYVLRLEREQLDLRVFERLVTEAEGAEAGAAGVRLREGPRCRRQPRRARSALFCGLGLVLMPIIALPPVVSRRLPPLPQLAPRRIHDLSARSRVLRPTPALVGVAA